MLKELHDQIIRFRDDRDWEQFHDPKNLSEALVIEASELLQEFLWIKNQESRELSDQKMDKVSEEIADVFIFLILLCHELNIDLNKAVKEKLKKNNAKYPIDKSYGSSKKYTELR